MHEIQLFLLLSQWAKCILEPACPPPGSIAVYYIHAFSALTLLVGRQLLLLLLLLEQGADLHTAQLMPLPLTVTCFSKIQIGFTFLVLAHPGSPGQAGQTCVCVCGTHRLG